MLWCTEADTAAGAIATQILLILLVGLMTWHFRAENRKADREGYAIQDDPTFRYTF